MPPSPLLLRFRLFALARLCDRFFALKKVRKDPHALPWSFARVDKLFPRGTPRHSANFFKDDHTSTKRLCPRKTTDDHSRGPSQ